MVLLFLAHQRDKAHRFTLMPLEVLVVGLSVQACGSSFTGLYRGHRLTFLLRKCFLSFWRQQHGVPAGTDSMLPFSLTIWQWWQCSNKVRLGTQACCTYCGVYISTWHISSLPIWPVMCLGHPVLLQMLCPVITVTFPLSHSTGQAGEN